MLNGSNLYELAKCYTDAIEETNLEFDSIFGPAYKGIFLGSIVATLLSEKGKNFPLCFNRKEEKDHGEGGSIIGDKPSGDVLIIDDVLSAGTAGRESIELIKEVSANPKAFIVGLDRQEKGNTDNSASQELCDEYNIEFISIINLDTLIEFVKSDTQFNNYLDELNEYREVWGA